MCYFYRWSTIFVLWMCLTETTVNEGYYNPKYLGCYKDEVEHNRLLEGSLEVLNTISVTNSCIVMCANRYYLYAGIENKNVCYCGQQFPSINVKVEQEQCNAVCSTKPNATCPRVLNVYETGIRFTSDNPGPDRRPRSSYLGCYKDTKVYANENENSILKGYWKAFENLTPTLCDKTCFEKGFLYFGMTYGNFCYCGDQQPSHNALLSDDKCYQPCPGDANQRCGGSWEFSIYSTGITNFHWHGKFDGCFQIGRISMGERIIKELNHTNSPKRCANICNQLGKEFGGVMNGVICMCVGWTKLTISSEDNKCQDLNCPGDLSANCGGSGYIKLFKTSTTDYRTEMKLKYMGCYKDQNEHRVLSGSSAIYSDFSAAEICGQLCYERGYPFAGLENGTECYCGDEFPSLDIRMNDEECHSKCAGDEQSYCGGILRIAVYETGISRSTSRPRSTYIGCYKDTKVYYNQRDGSILRGYWNKFENLNPTLCDETCYTFGFLYFGLTDGNICYCGDQRPSPMRLLPDNKCYQPCPGEPYKKCGGSWEFSVYSTGISDIVEFGSYVKCADIELLTKLNPLIKRKFNLTNSPKRCANMCGQLRYAYGAVMNAIECYCMKNGTHENFTDITNTCDVLPCPGDIDSKCGTNTTFKIFNTFEPGNEADIVDELTPSTVEQQPETCVKSETRVNGQLVCTEKLIFVNNFSSSDLKLWKYVIKIAAEPDYEFVTYGSASKNVYIKDGKLFIKPTVRSEDEVTSGSLLLRNCTGQYGTEECQKTAISFNILPPIESARITTENTFSFRYGTVTVKAKLPAGDWIIPDIRLVPVDQNQNSNGFESQLKLAFIRGNRNLRCGEQESGSTVLESGVYIRSKAENKAVTFTQQRSDSWSDEFHTFAVTWAPDTIIFLIDDEVVYATDNKELDIADSSIFNRNIWKAGVNTEVYLSIGISVGGIKNFPDTCYSNGRPKPWKNNEAKALLKFWGDKDRWSGSWNGESAALQIKEITVRALIN